MVVEITIDTVVVVRNPGELLVRTKLPEPFTKVISVAQKLSLGRMRKTGESKLLLQSLALTRRE